MTVAMRWIAAGVALCLGLWSAHAWGQALGVTITAPSSGSTVGGIITIEGTSQGLVNGRVSVSIDGGPFQLAQGVASWTFEWDTRTVPDGAHTITARARETIGGPAVTTSVQVVVSNAGGLSVAILSPAPGATVTGTFEVRGSSAGAIEVAVAVDTGAFQVANGLNPWSVIFEPGSLAPGPHTLRARARDGQGGEVFDTIAVVVAGPTPGTQKFAYVSSVDGTLLTGSMYVPAGYVPGGPPAGLVVYLHGGGGLGTVPGDWPAQLDALGWVLVAPDGRYWGLYPDCPWRTSAAYVNNPDPNVGPGEQDILDAIDWASQTFSIDPDRVYLSGFSMGGRGAYQIGLRHPDRFAALVPLAPASDMYEIFVRRPEPRACKEGMVGGRPGDSPFVDTMYTITSARFLIENAFNLPVFHGHGTGDSVAYNVPPAPGAPAQYLHGFHMLFDATWNGCHGASGLCFGHTPTLGELRQRHPEGYDWAYFFSDVGHQRDTRWTTGAVPAPGLQGVASVQNPGRLMGIFEFLAARTRVQSPETVVYKTYTDEHRRAYWVEIEISAPWTDTPGAVRARRDVSANALHVELARVARASIDLPEAGVALGLGRDLTISLEPLSEPFFDPALAAPGEPLAPTLVLRAPLGGLDGVRVLRDGSPLPAGQVSLSPGEVTIASQPVAGSVTLLVQALCYPDCNGDGLLNLADFGCFQTQFALGCP